MGGHVAGPHMSAGQPAGQTFGVPSPGMPHGCKRSAAFLASTGNDVPNGPRFSATSSGADAAFVTSVRRPRWRKAVVSCVAAATTAAAAASAGAAAAAMLTPQASALHRSAGSSTQLEELGREPPASTSVEQSSVASDPALRGHLSAECRQSNVTVSDCIQCLPLAESTTPLPQPLPGCLLQRHESAQSSASWLPAAEDSPGCELSEIGPSRGVAACLQLVTRNSAQRRDAVVAKPLLREVAAFQHPVAEGGSRQSPTRRPHADIVCDVKFSLDGELIATAGVGKQVCARHWRGHQRCCTALP